MPRQIVNFGKSGTPKVSEKVFVQQVIGVADSLGWLCYHTWRSDHSEAGYPDLTMVKGDRLIFAELKAEGKKPEPEQRRWLDALSTATREVYIWVPSDYDRIVRLLGGEPQ